MATETRHITHINNTEANLYANLDLAQSGIRSDGSEEMVYMNDDATKMYFLATQKYRAAGGYTYCNVEFADVKAYGDVYSAAKVCHTGDTDTYLNFHSDEDRVQLLVGNVNMIDIVENDVQDIIEINPADADVDTIINTTVADAVFVRGSDGFVGIAENSPDRLLHVTVTDATANAVSYAQRLTHQVLINQGANFGVGIEFEKISADLGAAVIGKIDCLQLSATGSEEISFYVGQGTDLMRTFRIMTFSDDLHWAQVEHAVTTGNTIASAAFIIAADVDNATTNSQAQVLFFINDSTPYPYVDTPKAHIGYKEATDVLSMGYGNGDHLAIISTGYMGVGETSPDRLLHVAVKDAVTTATSYALRLTHESSGTPGALFGVGIEFELENDTSDPITVVGAIESVCRTGVGGTEEMLLKVGRGTLYNIMRLGLISGDSFGQIESNTDAYFYIAADVDANGSDTDALLLFYIDGYPNAAGGTVKGTVGYDQGLDRMVIGYGADADVQIDTSGNVVIAGTTQTASLGIGRAPTLGHLDIAVSNTYAIAAICCYDNDATYPTLNLQKSDSDTIGTNSETDTNDCLGSVAFKGVNSSSVFATAASIASIQSAAAGASYIPADILFYTSTAAAAAAEAMRITSAKNVAIGTTTLDATAAKCLALANATAPAAHTDNQIYIYSADSSDAASTLALSLEQAVEDIGTFTASHKIKIRINGTEYWLQLDAV